MWTLYTKYLYYISILSILSGIRIQIKYTINYKLPNLQYKNKKNTNMKKNANVQDVVM